MTFTALALMGASYASGFWDSSGSPISPSLIDRIEYMRVLPECGDSNRRVKIRWKKRHTTKTYVVECPSGEVYLQWSKPQIDKEYRKELIKR